MSTAPFNFMQWLNGQAMPPEPAPDMGDVPSKPTPQLTGDAGPAPGETKGHKLLQILVGGVKGGLNGMAANAKTYAQTGRNAGFGGGFLGATQIPMQQAMQGQQLEQAKAQTELTKQAGQLVDTPWGKMPMKLAQVVAGPSIKAQSATDVQNLKNTSAENVANIQKRYVPVPGVGLFDTQTRQVMPGSEQGITITPEIAKDHNLPQAFIGKQLSLQQLAGLQRSDVFQNTPMMTASGPIVVNRRNSSATPVVGPGGQTYAPTSLASPKEIADPEHPGQTKIVPAGQSFGQAGVQSASVQVPKKAAVAEVPTNIGNQKVAFTTAIQHADLLRQAARALNNGDVQKLSSMENAFKNEFGNSGPVTAQAIAEAYTREAQKMLSGGHITDTEIAKVGKTLDPNSQNMDQIESVLNAYQGLAQSKMNMLNKQKNAAINSSQPKKPSGKAASNDPLGIR